ncbi:MAG: hypothetical protein NWR73_09455 [Flavobacteriales bacterium]|nr:hypothetical protein [Flavobacteriales bacterium]
MKQFLVIVFVACTLIAFGQQKEPKVSGNRWVFGGNVALSFTTNGFLIGASPTVGYRFTERLTAGGGGLYYYQSIRGFGQNYTASIYGPQLYARFVVGQSILQDGDRLFLQSDYYNINSKYYNPLNDEFSRIWVPQWYVGGGYFFQIGNNVFAGVNIMYDLIDDPNAAFPNPMIQGGISVGL